MLGKDDIQTFLQDLDKFISKDITIFMIGGGAMALKGLKPATVDIDLVLKTKAEFETLKSGLLKLDYKIDEELHDVNVYKQAVMVFLKGKSRVDIFIRSIVGMLDFTETMEKRSSLFKDYDNLNVRLSSNEDIFLLKSLSDREKDLPDNRTLIQTELDWNVIIKECVEQHRRETKWVFWLYEQICRIEDKFDLHISAKNRIFKVCQDNWSNKPSDFMLEFDDELIKKHVILPEQKEILRKKQK